MNKYEYDYVIKKLLGFFCDELGFVLVPTQQRQSILAACEDVFNVMKYDFGARILPLPQTGQMWLEYELLADPTMTGCCCITTSYRDEPPQRREAGRHDLVFQMFEFETHGDMEVLHSMLKDLLEFLGFPKHDAYRHKEEYPAIEYSDAATILRLHEGHEIESRHEEKLRDLFGEVCFLTDFPEFTSPFWNMKRKWSTNTARKIDVILCGMEAIGSAERSTDSDDMRRRFNSIKDGLYASELERRFGKQATRQELEEFLSFNFFMRCGGGIGLNRLIRAMKICGLMPDFSEKPE
ncbi:MAG: transposase [Candidatus Niyogibacteria bacterium CG10_big_fil_rev_8_21_14_0_10_46_36]|uniref:Transposase n=1 Tax=Candidatus Niyogibacteria bacterium CG10_big_fil_rev_8_21_14_0_10_46_36 TaxID=1974726 RepID=A0A2H0TE33_9BACT|nr:MAG: transposase [Candidatus Niyogibacteria bacterium CG10_big_fil_rev_8_21_14_0_10_46_36]